MSGSGKYDTRMTGTHRDNFGRTINHDHSTFRLYAVPLLTIIFGSLTPLLPVIAAGPIIPPVAFMFLIAWRIQRPGLLPMWIGLPLGAFDDLFSGQPFGSAILLWSVAMLVLEAIETRFPWRGFWQDWITASALVAGYLVLAAFFAAGGIDLRSILLILPQLALSVCLFPLFARMVSFFDRIRLLRTKRVD